MKYKTHYLKPGISAIIDRSFPKELEVGEAYKISFDFKPVSETEGYADNISVKQISVPDEVKIK